MVLQVSDLSKQYERGGRSFFAVNHVSLEIDEGAFAFIVGRSGSGKSTLLNMVSGLLTPTTGSVIIDGEELVGKNDRELSAFRNDKIGFVPQGADVLYNLDVLDNVALPFFLCRHEGDVYGKAQLLLEKLGISHLASAYPNELSGGELRRVQIARAMINDPKIVIADEPTSDLDLENTKLVMQTLQKLNREGVTLLIVTHELDTLPYGTVTYTMTDGHLEKGQHI